jgi:hypothetical protein
VTEKDLAYYITLGRFWASGIQPSITTDFKQVLYAEQDMEKDESASIIRNNGIKVRRNQTSMTIFFFYSASHSYREVFKYLIQITVGLNL